MAKLLCPHCGISLGGKLLKGKPLPRERKFLPNKAVLVCPSCKGELHPNLQPAHFWYYLAFLPFIVSFYLMLGGEDKKFWFLVMAGALALALLVSGYVYFKYLRGLPRFSATKTSIKVPFTRWRV